MRDNRVVDGDHKMMTLPQAPEAIELRHLRAFVAVADDLSFSRAAQRLFITQPALSRQIRGLERLVGCDLFRRSTQRVQLTLAGEALLARARTLLTDLDDAVTATRSVGGELAGRMALLWEPWARAAAGAADWDQLRAAIEELHGQFAPPPEVTVTPVVAGGAAALRVTPDQPSDAKVCYLHGGGYVAGSAFGYRHLAGAAASAAHASALVVDYRLAPEHPYPAAVQDAVNAYLWLLDTGTAPGNIVVAGDSSGGGLAMSMLLALRERDLPQPAGAVLMCPWVDLDGRTQRPSREAPILFSPEQARRLAGAYLDGQLADDPILTPLSTDLAGLPPLLIQAASGDSVLQEAQLLAAHGTECGVDTAITVYPVPTHDFHVFWSFLPEAMKALEELGVFIRRQTAPGARGNPASGAGRLHGRDEAEPAFVQRPGDAERAARGQGCPLAVQAAHPGGGDADGLVVQPVRQLPRFRPVTAQPGADAVGRVGTAAPSVEHGVHRGLGDRLRWPVPGGELVERVIGDQVEVGAPPGKRPAGGCAVPRGERAPQAVGQAEHRLDDQVRQIVDDMHGRAVRGPVRERQPGPVGGRCLPLDDREIRHDGERRRFRHDMKRYRHSDPTDSISPACHAPMSDGFRAAMASVTGSMPGRAVTIRTMASSKPALSRANAAGAAPAGP
jgi:acetyl esterase/lipase